MQFTQIWDTSTSQWIQTTGIGSLTNTWRLGIWRTQHRIRVLYIGSWQSNAQLLKFCLYQAIVGLTLTQSTSKNSDMTGVR